ncbi:tetratricopeptide repeat protein [Pseudofrankia sp. DC12]|uniref:tetratricopeptide repeat protein n=1 Tax=Pseudofrankia sp. DC12 TaxID=683315 RepID=UPI000A0264ED|nr:tetratricopeptide repeat protein [Pseudofrankia sp. DC12]
MKELSEQEIQALIDAFPGPVEAREILIRAGVRAGSVTWESVTATMFWRGAARQLASGLLIDGALRLLEAASDERPGNFVFTAGVKARRPASGPRPSAREDPVDPANWPRYEGVLAGYLRAPAQSISDAETDAKLRADLLKTCTYLHAVGRYDVARELAAGLRGHLTVALGVDDLDTWAAAHHLASALLGGKDYETAAVLLTEVLAARERRLGARDPATSATRANLGVALTRLNRLQDAEDHLRTALRDRIAILGANHGDTVMSRLNLAAWHREREEADDAYRLDAEALASAEKHLGGKHPLTLEAVVRVSVDLIWLARGYQKRDAKEANYALAVEGLRRGHGGRMEIFGADSVATLESAAPLVAVLLQLRRWVEAEPLARRTFLASQRVLGPSHPLTSQLGRYLELAEEAMQARRRR